jgi:hypothetical protein
MTDCPFQSKSPDSEAIGAKSMLSLLLFVSLLAMLLPVQALANQSASGRQRKGAIKGRVLYDSGQPFANAVVSISPLKDSDNDEREVLTEEDGSFHAKDLAVNLYTVTCQSPGYIQETNEGARRYHGIGDSVVLRLRKGAVITGMVTDSKGKPVENAQVNLLSLSDVNQPPRSISEVYNSETTDDRGIYRFYGLFGGSYLVFVNKIGSFADEELRQEIPIYFPSATRDTAQVVKVNAGQEAEGINIIYRSEPGHSISGSFSGALRKDEPVGQAYLKLIDARSSALEAANWKGQETTHRFAFQGLPDGEYYLLAEDDEYEPKAASAPHHIVVKGTDVSGIELTLTPLASLEGRVTIEALPQSQRQALCSKMIPSFLEEVIVSVSGETAKSGKPLPAWLTEQASFTAPDEKGNFILPGLAPGQYQPGVKFINEDLYIRSIALRQPAAKNRGIATRNAIQLKPGERLTGMTVTLAQGAAQLRGRVAPANPATKLPSLLRVYLVPAEAQYADEEWRFAQTDAQSDGTFSFTNLAPGHYRFVLRSISKDDAAETLHPKLWDAAFRKLLQREAASANRAIELQTCQQINEYSLLYPLPSAPAAPLEEKAQEPEDLRVKSQAAEPRPASGKARSIQKRTKNH